LKGEINPIKISSNPANIWGQTSGELVGGNLKIIETLCGTSSNLKTEGKILFLEDTDEYLYSIDRMFWNLKRSGKLNNIKGLMIGGFKTKPDDPGEEFGLSLEQLVLEKIKNVNIPVCFGFPVGHQKHNMALICGANYRLTVNADEAVLESI
jgi:muramoyltetrapeptide carboxypeptidase